ncbi:hypothetical protein TNCV_2841831 [Trichonephila clavipes]|uniref:RING-type domain-containing protein n=1 Tax=Trichonephila clavipes TaxID=2585209 RepID=A0A8X6V7S6_TRICX|nr:hypothetical protein TNCV_2841831 [Trichonephila clavipes]
MEEDNIYRLTMEEVLFDKRINAIVAARHVQRSPGDERYYQTVTMLSVNMGTSASVSFCAICQKNELHRRWMWLICDHMFHYSCLMEWFTNNPICPLCRA